MSSTRFRFALLTGLVVVFLAGVIGSAVIAVLAASGVGGDAAETQQRREAVMSQARQFMLRVNTYGPDLLEGDQMPEYRDLVTDVMTDKFETSFLQGVTAAEQTVAQAGIERTAEVFSTGVSELEEGRATVLVAGAFTNSYPARGKNAEEGERVETEPQSFRVEVELVRTDGEWLVDDFSPVTAEEEQTP
ncbi:hypothetical protein [Nocardioides sp. SYSU DS0663]|uniref:hypothetical protein n=1 Tax=Nocardioides sp. SYSU DS0663 TaxID=3416445 RepID=UPI003F4B804C